MLEVKIEAYAAVFAVFVGGSIGVVVVGSTLRFFWVPRSA